MIGKKLNLVYSFCLLIAISACDKKDSAETQDLKNQVRLANTMAANLWCKNDSYYPNERNTEMIVYQGLGKINSYSVRKKNDPRQSWGYRLIAFKTSADDKVDYEYVPGAEFPAKDLPAGTPRFKMDIRPALRKDWRETKLTSAIPEEILNSMPARELVLRSRSYYGSETTTVYHPCASAGTGFVEFLNKDESIANDAFIRQTEGRTLNARDNTNADRLMEIEWPVREFALSGEYLSSRKFCSITPAYNGVNVEVYSFMPDGLIRVTTANWSSTGNKGTAKASTPANENVGSDVRVKWEFKNGTLRLYAKNAQPWDVIGGRNIYVAKGFQDPVGRVLIYPLEGGSVRMTLQDCERFRNPTTGGMIFGALSLSGDPAKDSFESSAATDTLYSDLNILKK